MNSDYIHLSYIDVSIAGLLIGITVLLSFALKLNLEKRLLMAACRTVVQLLLLAWVLHWIFALNKWYWVALYAAFITLIAGITATRRVKRKHPGMVMNAIGSIWLSSWIVLGFGILLVVRTEPWYSPQYLIPLLGMMLGNMLNGVSLGLDRLGEELLSNRRQVETLLALGATRWEAARTYVRSAIATGMVPIINSMMIVGLVSLPGMMTGQLMAGAPPLDAVKYQIIIMFLIGGATGLGTIFVTLLGYYRLFTPRHQFCHWLIKTQKT